MDNETHYLTYDPEEIYNAMQEAYIEAGGDILYPGDEKEMLLRAVQGIMVQAFAGTDNALRMATLRYAVGDYLDLYGDQRGCARIPARAATAEIDITFAASGTAATIPAGTTVTADGDRLYQLTEDVAYTGYQQTVRTTVAASETGSAGNGLTAGTQMQFISPQSAVLSVYAATNATGGQEKEEDEAYRERIRVFGLANITTGPAMQYEAAAKAVSSEILDARASNISAGNVGIALLLASETGAQGIIDQVHDALNGETVRPLTDTVTVTQAEDVTYTLHVQYQIDTGSSIAAAVAEVVAEYQKWQDQTIGRAFNPDRLMSFIYQAGASRVIWGEGSEFDGGTVEYTEISADQHCKGTITIEVIE